MSRTARLAGPDGNFSDELPGSTTRSIPKLPRRVAGNAQGWHKPACRDRVGRAESQGNVRRAGRHRHQCATGCRRPGLGARNSSSRQMRPPQAAAATERMAQATLQELRARYPGIDDEAPSNCSCCEAQLKVAQAREATRRKASSQAASQHINWSCRADTTEATPEPHYNERKPRGVAAHSKNRLTAAGRRAEPRAGRHRQTRIAKNTRTTVKNCGRAAKRRSVQRRNRATVEALSSGYTVGDGGRFMARGGATQPKARGR